MNAPSSNGHPYDQLTPDLILDAIESVGYTVNGRFYPLNSYENRVYQIGIEDQTPLIAKFYRPGRWQTAQIEEELAFTCELAAAEVPVVAPILLPNGQWLAEHAGFRFALFPQRGGQAPDTSDPDTLYRLGQWLGQMHNVGASAAYRTRLQLSVLADIDEALAELEQRQLVPLPLRPAWDSLVRDVRLRCQQRLDDTGSFDTLRLHGDCHGGNILVRDTQFLFVDFDDSLTGPAVQDFWPLLNGERHEQSQQLGELIEGYEMFREFDRKQLRLIDCLRVRRIISYNAWLAKRWDDPTFPMHFPWFAQERYWSDQILALREQLSSLQEAPLAVF